jgi:hypothetical protein
MRNIFYEFVALANEIAIHFQRRPRRLPAMKVFTDHPRSVGESYWQHMGVALSFAGAMSWGAAASLLHAIFPFLCTRTGSSIVLRLHERVAKRR